MTVIKRAMVLAAGKGTRLGELTKETPKPLVDLGGVTPLYRILKGLEYAGIEEVVVNCHWRAEKIIKAVQRWQGEGLLNMQIHLSYEEELLETAGGICNAIGYFKDEPFILANGDIVWGEGFSKFVSELMENYDENKMDFMLALTSVDHSRKDNGDFRLYKDGKLDYLDENEISEASYCGLSVVHPRAFDLIKPGFAPLSLAWREAVTQQKFYGYKADYPWVDMGTPEGLEKAKLVIKKEQTAKVLKFGA